MINGCLGNEYVDINYLKNLDISSKDYKNTIKNVEKDK